MRCSIVIVTFNGWQYTNACLTAIEHDLQPGMEVVVVDNASGDGSPHRIREQFPAVRLIECQNNIGFAAAANLAINRSESDTVLLLNNDVEIERGFIHELLAPFERSPRIGSVAGALVFQRRPDIVASAGIEVFRNGLALDLSVGSSRSEIVDCSIFGASGGAAAYRRSALKDVGLLPETFFMYLEDVDLAWRLRLRGWESVLAAQAIATHAVSASSIEGSTFKRKLLARNRIWSMIRCIPGRLLVRYGWRIARYDGIVVLSAPFRRDGSSALGRISAIGGLPARFAERREIQARRTASLSDLDRWLQPDVGFVALRKLRMRVRELASDSSSTGDVCNNSGSGALNARGDR